MTKITFHTGNQERAKWHVEDKDQALMVIIDANQCEFEIVNDSFEVLNRAREHGNAWYEVDIFSYSELALTAVRNWCFHNKTSIEVQNWNWVNTKPIISTIDQDGRIEGEYPFGKNVELLMELM